MTRGPNSQHGFSIVEVLVAIVVLAIGILATATVFASSDSTTFDSELHQVATAKAESVIEELRSIPYSELGHFDPEPLEPLVLAEPEEEGEESRLGTMSPSGRAGFRPPDADAFEELVTPANSEGGDSDTGVIEIGEQPGQQSQTFEFDPDAPGVGAEPVDGQVFTFVTWRDGDCADILGADLAAALDEIGGLAGTALDSIQPVIDEVPTEISGGLQDVQDSAQEIADQYRNVGAIDVCDIPRATLKALTGLVERSADGSFEIHEDIAGIDVDLSAHVNAVDIAAQELAAALADLDAAEQVFDAAQTALDEAQIDLSAAQSDLNSAQAALQDAINALQGLTCPNPLIPLLCQAFNQAQTAVNAAQTAVDLAQAAVVEAQADLDSAQQSVNELSAVVTAAEDALEAALNDLVALFDAPAGGEGSILDAISEDLDTLLANPIVNTTHNTKRITVGVVIDTGERNDVTPSDVVWLSSVVTDPEDGIVG